MFSLLNLGIAQYSRMGDVAVIAVCVVIFILLSTSYVVRDKSFRIFCAIVGLVTLAAALNVGYNVILSHSEWLKDNANLRGLVYVLRILYHSILFDVFFSFGLYTAIVAKVKHKQAQLVAIVGMGLFLGLVAADIVLTITGIGFKIGDDGVVIKESNLFMIGYLAYIAFFAVLLFYVRKLVYKRVIWAFYLTGTLAVIIRVAQAFLNQSSLTTLVFLLPALTMLYTLHLNPYNVKTGTLDVKAMEDMIKNLYEKEQPFIIMSMLLPDFVGEGKAFPEFVIDQTRRFTLEYFRNGTLFQVGNGQTIMIATKSSNPDYNEWMQTILQAFQKQYGIHKIAYKIVYGDSYEKSINHNEYLSLIENIHKNISNNTMHRIEEKDINRYKESVYIIEQLKDIYQKADLNDPRVLVYTQPVYNIQTKRFDTAEALMRLKLDNIGIVSPLVFIPIAESRGFIHVLTKIILNKTCQTIRHLIDEEVPFNRISINVSAIELKDDGFCDEFNQILKDNDVPGDSVAIELTESQSEEDFLVMKQRIEKLHSEGIRFYLDDFGTGYSNMERILELPFDIIKFDRSMVIASGQDERSERIVENLAKIFSDFNYFVLYEGVEDNADEDRCLGMSATYLQGFKYSRPIPIEELQSFLSRV